MPWPEAELAYENALLPHALIDQLNPYFVRAKKRLSTEALGRGSRSWLGKVAVVHETDVYRITQNLPFSH